MSATAAQTQAAGAMKRAARRVTAVAGEPYKTQYGALCHSFPVMVRTCGLAQAVAFSAAKANPADAGLKAAHARVVDDVRDLLGLPEGGAKVVAERIADLSVVEYVVATRRVLKAWIYYKRFAESILKVASAAEAEDDR
ncbi:MAG: type III-B CRISPR module-associated protein Cmr5 [Fimbriimonadaceae bacterium]